MDELTIPARFNGPPDSGNGGYACGRLAAGIKGPAEVELRAPPPLERVLTVERDGETLVALDGDVLVARARPAEVALELPAAVSLERAEEASRAGYERWSSAHPFPSCVVCGPERPWPDGLGVYPGALDEGGLFASVWLPEESLAHGGDEGSVPAECVWAALDCPTSAPVANFGEGPPIVLASLAASLERPAAVGEPHVIVSWPLELDGRKRRAGAALFDSGGELVACARALWIELRRE